MWDVRPIVCRFHVVSIVYSIYRVGLSLCWYIVEYYYYV